MTTVDRAIGDVRALMATDEARYTERRLRDFPVITCHKGCSHCCYWPLGVSLLEALVLHEWLVKNRRWTTRLQDELRQNAGKVTGLDHDVWKMARIPCPLLKDATCSVYEARPFVCRLVQSVGDPFDCQAHRVDKSPNFVPATGYMFEYYDKLREIHKRCGVDMVTMPLSVALLAAARVASGEVELFDADKIIHAEHRDAIR